MTLVGTSTACELGGMRRLVEDEWRNCVKDIEDESDRSSMSARTRGPTGLEMPASHVREPTSRGRRRNDASLLVGLDGSRAARRRLLRT
jgi:hypothetical protein